MTVFDVPTIPHVMLAKCLFLGCMALVRHVDTTPPIIRDFALTRNSSIDFINIYPTGVNHYSSDKTQWWLNHWDNDTIITSYSFFTPTFSILMDAHIPIESVEFVEKN